MNVTVLPGDYLVVDTPGLIDGLIRIGDLGPMNHAFTSLERTVISHDSGAWARTSGGGTIAEAGGKGMQESLLDGYLTNARHMAVSRDELTPAERGAIVAMARTEISARVPYGFPTIAYLALYRFGFRWPAFARWIARRHMLICSQAVARQYAAAGVDVMPHHADSDVSPETLALRPGVLEVW